MSQSYAASPVPADVARAVTEAPFTQAREAWLWAVEVLRRRRLPTRARIWADDGVAPQGWWQLQAAQLASGQQAADLDQETAKVAARWAGGTAMPQDGLGRLALALQVMKAKESLAADHQQVLQLWGWGDWADEGRLRAALAVQEKARREGMRVRLSYRYSLTQVGMVLGLSKDAVWRRQRAAEKALAKALEAAGLLLPPPSSGRPVLPARQAVRRADFRPVR